MQGMGIHDGAEEEAPARSRVGMVVVSHKAIFTSSI